METIYMEQIDAFEEAHLRRLIKVAEHMENGKQVMERNAKVLEELKKSTNK